MSHFSQEEWKAFITNTLQEDLQSIMEDHLYACDECLAEYLQVNEQINPMEVPDAPVDQIDILLNEMNISIQKYQGTKKNNTIKPIWQYVIAASLTIALMSSGMFQHVTGIWSEAESDLSKNTHTSITEDLMNRTLSVIDRLQQTK